MSRYEPRCESAYFRQPASPAYLTRELVLKPHVVDVSKPKRDVIYCHANLYTLSYEILKDVHRPIKIAPIEKATLAHTERRLTGNERRHWWSISRRVGGTHFSRRGSTHQSLRRGRLLAMVLVHLPDRWAHNEIPLPRMRSFPSRSASL